MTDEEIIKNEKYHTCGRCKHKNTPDGKYPCISCIYGPDHRTDLWELERNVTIYEPKRKWTPASERLPEDRQRVLVTIVNYYGYKAVRVAEYFDKFKEFQIKETGERWDVDEERILAWMPLPEAYKEEE